LLVSFATDRREHHFSQSFDLISIDIVISRDHLNVSRRTTNEEGKFIKPQSGCVILMTFARICDVFGR